MTSRVVLAGLAALPLLLNRPAPTPAPAPSPAARAPVAAPATSAPVRTAAEVALRRGIDVSHHQGTIDWDAVAGDGVEFAWMKATEGATFRDASFARNWRGAGAAGIARGAYHRFRPNRDAGVQARHFLANLPAGFELPAVLDVEATDGVSDARLLRGVRTWLAEVERATGVRPMVYTRASFRRRHLGTALDDYPLWIAEYDVGSPSVDGWVAWQHSTRGHVAGVTRAVDLDRMRVHPRGPLARAFPGSRTTTTGP